MAILGIDLGTSSVKVIILATYGQMLGVSQASYNILSAQSNWAESDPEEWWNATVAAVKAALKQAPTTQITAIGLSGQMHGVVLAYANGMPARTAILWADTRAEAELNQYQALPAENKKRLANPLVPGMAGPLLLWLAQHEKDVYQTSRWALQPKDWLRLRLTGIVATDPSDASATLLYDLQSDRWADDIIATLGIKRDLLPAIIPSAAYAGSLTQQAANALGLSVGLPVATGAADTAAAALGTGLLATNAIQLTLGTGAQLLQLKTKPEADPTLRTHLYRAADESHWYAMAAVQNAGLVLDWVRHLLQADWEEVYASADTVIPGSNGLTFLPYLTRERAQLQHPDNGGAFLNLRANHQRSHLLHAALEGVAFGIRMALETLPEAEQTTTLRLAGGGSVHPAWQQMIADILGKELLQVNTSAASARGAALLGGIASGIWTNAQATAQVAPSIQATISPNPQRVAIYTTLYESFLQKSTSIPTSAK